MSHPNKAQRGMTLTEVMVYCVLLSFLSLLLFVNLPQAGNQSREDLRVATQQASRALNRLTLELSNSSASSVLLHSSPPGVQFLSAQSETGGSFSYTSGGELAWRGWVAYTLRGQELVRLWYPLPAPRARASVGSPPSLATMLSGGKSQVVCRGVRSFSALGAESNLWRAELVVSVGNSQTTVSSAAGARN